MKTIKRDVPGHFCASERCGFFLHVDVVADGETDAYTNADYCISLIGEYGSPGEWGNLNISGKTYELAVFDKASEDPWMEIEMHYIHDKQEAIAKHRELVTKYTKTQRLAAAPDGESKP